MNGRDTPEPATGAGRPLVTACAVTGLALVAGAAIPLLPPRVRGAANLAAAAAALAIARAGGLRARDLGCEADAVRSGLAAGGTVAGLSAAAIAATAGPPATRSLFVDARVTDVSRGRAAFEVAVRIPLATALTEELLFRGAVLGAWRRAIGTPGAVVVSSLAFGVWHVLPALEAHAHNPAGADLADRVGGRSAHVAGTVVATAVAGALFAGLRLRSRSVLAPTLVHAAVNQAGYLTSRWVHGRIAPA